MHQKHIVTKTLLTLIGGMCKVLITCLNQDLQINGMNAFLAFPGISRLPGKNV